MTKDPLTKLTLIEVVLEIVRSRKLTTPQEIFSDIQNYPISFVPNPISLKLYLRKLASQRIIKHEFRNNQYEISLTEKGKGVLEVLKHKLII